MDDGNSRTGTGIFAGTAAMFWMSPDGVQALQTAFLGAMYAYIITKSV